MGVRTEAMKVYIELRDWLEGRRAVNEDLEAEVKLVIEEDNVAILVDLGGIMPCPVELWCSCEDGIEFLSFDFCRRRLSGFVAPLESLLFDDGNQTSFRVPDDLDFGRSKN